MWVGGIVVVEFLAIVGGSIVVNQECTTGECDLGFLTIYGFMAMAALGYAVLVLVVELARWLTNPLNPQAP